MHCVGQHSEELAPDDDDDDDVNDDDDGKYDDVDGRV